MISNKQRCISINPFFCCSRLHLFSSMSKTALTELLLLFLSSVSCVSAACASGNCSRTPCNTSSVPRVLSLGYRIELTLSTPTQRALYWIYTYSLTSTDIHALAACCWSHQRLIFAAMFIVASRLHQWNQGVAFCTPR